MDYLAQFGYHWFWFGLATVLLAIEVVHGRFMFMAGSFAAAVIGGLSHFFPYVAFEVQLLFFAVAAAGFIWLSRSYLRERMAKIQLQQDILLQRRYVGQVLTLVNPIESGHASQNMDGVVWSLQGKDCPAGSQVKVVDMGEGWLKVEPV